MTPLRVLQGLYAAVFAGVFVGFLILRDDRVRPGVVLLGALAATFGLCVVLNLFGMAQEMADKSKHSRWTPPVYGSVTVCRLFGLFFFVVGCLFTYQAAFSPDF